MWRKQQRSEQSLSPPRPVGSRSRSVMEFEIMESDILEGLEDLGYKGPLLDDGALTQATSHGATSPEFTKLCAWLVSELRLFCKLEENVHATNSPNEAEEFQLEASGLLAEMNCPYVSLTSGDVTKRLLNQKNCVLLLTYLISELEAARMLCVNAPPKKAQEGGGSEVFQELKGICIALGMSKPPANITMFQFFSGIEKKLKETLAKVPPNHVGKPLLKKQLGPAHWEKIEAINQAIANEYEVRRKLLVKRLDVTVQSFGWSERAKSQTEKLAKIYQPKRALLSTKCTISIANLLAARQDLSKIMRTSSGSIREKTACAINKVLMGRVPDRGGRPNEIEPPPPEMPPWQKRPEGTQQQGIATTEMQVFKQVAIMVVVADTKEVATAVISLHIQEVDTRVVAVAATNRTTDTKMVGPTVIEEVGVEEGEVAVEVVVAVEAKEEAGEAEVDRTLIKGGSLSSTSNMEAISITSLDLDKEDTLLAEATKVYTSAELK
ncbi:protein FAM98A [Alligator mississippiensis]|uniref:Protein FAM98A n=1 Tax=Alligator mississippiensis TaxID=8496 RepID=A0A151MHD4_ALLMI|nr:protein FAM98A [Alligator mississippiensis]